MHYTNPSFGGSELNASLRIALFIEQLYGHHDGTRGFMIGESDVVVLFLLTID